MATMSAMPTAAPGLTPPSSSHGNGNSNANTNGYAWNNYSAPGNDENPMNLKKSTATNYNDATSGFARSPLISQNGNSASFSHHSAPKASTRKDAGAAELSPGTMPGAAYLSPPYGSSTVRAGSVKENPIDSSDSLPDTYGSSRSAKRTNAEASPTIGPDGDKDESSKWIHRDKLARIESEELQAAGIILPAPRSRSRPRHAQDRLSNSRKASDADLHGTGRSRKNSTTAGTGAGPALGDIRGHDIAAPSWDLRLPDEIAEADEANYWTSTSGTKGSSRIPVAKLSPLPLPVDVLERDTLARRRRDSSPNDEAGIKMPRTRARSSSASTKLEAAAAGAIGASHQPRRSVTDTSPKKTTGAGAKKQSGPGKAIGANGRPKTRGGPSKDSTSSGTGTRPSTRSGERELASALPANKQPEGDPPWMISAYKPDPRLPPDQQLLPTVAKRLQQEKWEREGKFGSIYDKEFRPLTEDGFLAPPEPKDKLSPSNREEANEKPDEKSEDWPLKAEPKSPNSLRQQRTGSYSTIPKVQDPPLSPIPPGSRGNAGPALPSPLVRVPDVPEDDQKQEKKGCMCCIVM